MKRKRKEKEKKRKEKKRKKKKKPNSLPSLHERSETPGALDRCESQETPVAQFHLSALVRITGHWCSACRRGRQESTLYTGAEPATRLLGRQHSDPSLQVNEPSQLPAKTEFKYLYLSRLKWVACAS